MSRGLLEKLLVTRLERPSPPLFISACIPSFQRKTGRDGLGVGDPFVIMS